MIKTKIGRAAGFGAAAIVAALGFATAALLPSPAAYPAPGTPNQPPGGYAPSGLAGSPSITYTPRRGWRNAQGQYCREYRTTGSAGNRTTERYGTACRDASSQWRIVN
jgi:hypothetical protein